MNDQKQKQKLEEFSILIEQELAESVANALTGIFPAGLVQERVYKGVFPHELDQARTQVRVFGYFPAAEKKEYHNKIQKKLESLSEFISLPDPFYSLLEEQNWATAWQDRYHPIPLGKNLIVVPSWLENPHPERTSIFMDPGMAFGSGTHPTTKLSLVLLETCLDKYPHADVIDIGCGSGILSIAAAKLGAIRVLGVDIDPDVIQVSRDNAEFNAVAKRTVFQEGTVTSILNKETEISRASLVVANIIAPILTQLLEDGLGKLVSPGGLLILSGILEEQLPGILECLRQGNFKIKDQYQQKEWAAVLAERIDS